MKTTNTTTKAKSAACEKVNRIVRAARLLQRRLDEFRRNKLALEAIAFRNDARDTQEFENDVFAMECCLHVCRMRFEGVVWEDLDCDNDMPVK